MFCSKCGCKHPDTSKFCPNCGQPIDSKAGVPIANNDDDKTVVISNFNSAQPQAPVQPQAPAQPQAPVQPPVQPIVQQPQEKRKFPIIPILIGLVVIAAAVFLVLFLTRKKPMVININDYVSVEFTGVNSHGQGAIKFDRDKFLVDYEDEIECNDDDFMSKYSCTPAEIVYNDLSLGFNLDKDENLSNGDTVILKLYYNEELFSDTFGVEIEYLEIESEVNGLTDAVSKDPFEDIELSYSGTDGLGSVSISYKGNLDLEFYADTDSNLSLGQEVTVYAYYNGDIASAESLLEDGVILTKTSQTYVVPPLPYYAKSFADISEDAFNDMIYTTKDLLNNYDFENNNVTLGASDYSGCYMLSAIDADSASLQNKIMIVFVYELIPDEFNKNDYGFFVASFDNIIINPDGSYYFENPTGYIIDYRNSVQYGKKKTASFDAPGYDSIEDFENYYLDCFLLDYEYSKFSVAQ